IVAFALRARPLIPLLVPRPGIREDDLLAAGAARLSDVHPFGGRVTHGRHGELASVVLVVVLRRPAFLGDLASALVGYALRARALVFSGHGLSPFETLNSGSVLWQRPSIRHHG